MQNIQETAEWVRKKLAQVAQDSLTIRSAEEAIKCAKCGDRGYIHVENGVVRCECQKQKAIAAQVRAIPSRFRSCTFDNYAPGDVRQRHALDCMVKDITGNFYLFGNWGHGKTHLLSAQYMKLVEIEYPCMLLTMSELVSELRRAEIDSDYYSKLRDRVRHAERFHLFVDDIDKFKPTEFKFETLHDLFDTLYRRELGLTATGNLSPDELRSSGRLDIAVIRRIEDMCAVCEV